MNNFPLASLRATITSVCLILGVLAPSLSHANSPELTKLLQLVDQRLQVMDDVALYKFAHGIPIENKQREAVVLASVIKNAGENNLKPESVEGFFRLQITLAKQIQQGWTDQWRSQGKSPTTVAADIPDLKTDIRPELITLGAQIVKQFPLALPALHDPAQLASSRSEIRETITSPYISTEMKHRLLHAMAMVQVSTGTHQTKLQAVLKAGVLRVGTTGDYKPFSYVKAGENQATKQFAGIDIDMAQNLADSLGVKLRLVQTSWPTLMADLAADKFDVGMSGISRALKRRRHAFFSDQYVIGGKTSIGRCDDVSKLNSLERIDRPDIRVVVNPGGTNQKFVQANIRKAKVMVYSDNNTIFEQIRDGHADVMITDDIEVKLQQKQHPTLCATMPGTLLTYSEKGYLLPQDSAFKEYLDGWLQQVKHSGKLKAALSHHLE